MTAPDISGTWGDLLRRLCLSLTDYDRAIPEWLRQRSGPPMQYVLCFTILSSELMNQASTSSLAPTLPRTITVSNEEYTISLHEAPQLPPAVRDRIYTLFHQNMAPLSQESSLEYTEVSKREELFDETGRFLLLQRGGSLHEGGIDMPGALPSGKRKEDRVERGEEQVMGYVSFRFDTEETLGRRDAEVVYWYVPRSTLSLDLYIIHRSMSRTQLTVAMNCNSIPPFVVWA